MELNPSEIRYAQDSIAETFADHTPLTSTFARLLAGELSSEDLPPIECLFKDGNWYATSGNRRLYLFKKLKELGRLDKIAVSRVYHCKRRFTTECDGLHVKCRGSGLERKMEKIVEDWRRGGDIVFNWCDDDRIDGNFT